MSVNKIDNAIRDAVETAIGGGAPFDVRATADKIHRCFPLEGKSQAEIAMDLERALARRLRNSIWPISAKIILDADAHMLQPVNQARNQSTKR